MIRNLYAVPAMLCLAAALVSAQAPTQNAPAAEKPAAQTPTPQPAAQQPTTPRPATPPAPVQEPARETLTMAAKKVTYTGCLKPGTATGSWILENAEVAQRAGASTTPSTVGTSGTAKMSFNLNPAATVNLKPHANHKVEVVGILSPARSSADATAAPSTPAAPQAAARQQFSVESVNMVSATCP